MHSRDMAVDIFESLMCGFVVLLPSFDLLNLLEKYWKDVSLQHVLFHCKPAFLLPCIKDLTSGFCY